VVEGSEAVSAVAATYRITLKGWDRQYGEGHVLDSRRFEVKRRSKKADKEAVEALDDMLQRHPPQSSDRSAFAWAEVSDRYGPETLAKYTNDRGKWVGEARPELRGNAEGDPPWLLQINIDRDKRSSTLFGIPQPPTGVFDLSAVRNILSYLRSATSTIEEGEEAPEWTEEEYEEYLRTTPAGEFLQHPLPAGKEHVEIFVHAPGPGLVADLELPLPGNVRGWVSFRETKVQEDFPGVEVGAVISMAIDWEAAASSVLETFGASIEAEDVDDFAARLEESPPGLELSRAVEVTQQSHPFSRSADPTKLLPGVGARTPGAYLVPKGQLLDWAEIISDYFDRVEGRFYEVVDKGAEDLYAWSRSVLTGEPIEAAELAVAGEYAETPLAMNARRRPERIERSTEGLHSLMAQLEEPERTRLEQCIEECETEEQMRAVTSRFARNARKRKRKKRGAAHETETAEERTERMRRQRSEWENVTN
jgi:hypothetical protein